MQDIDILSKKIKTYCNIKEIDKITFLLNIIPTIVYDKLSLNLYEINKNLWYISLNNIKIIQLKVILIQ